MNSDKAVYPFGDYFSDANFKRWLDDILMDSGSNRLDKN
jgi:hypothetical protein